MAVEKLRLSLWSLLSTEIQRPKLLCSSELDSVAERAAG